MPELSAQFLNRFTTIPFVIDMLTRKQLTLVNPGLWEDYNDRATMELYRRKKDRQSIYALCMTYDRETIHHWNAFANGISGCCIEFDYERLLGCLHAVEDISHGKTEYLRIKDLDELDPDIEKIPYVKRRPFHPEKEFRILALNDNSQQATLDIPIDLRSIRRITLSNKLPATTFRSMKKTMEKISDEFKGRISHSTLFNNEVWTHHFR